MAAKAAAAGSFAHCLRTPTPSFPLPAVIRFFLLQNRAGKTRLAKYYTPLSDDDKLRTEVRAQGAAVARPLAALPPHKLCM